MKDSHAEVWIPRCPRCGEGNIILASANGFTKHLPLKTEVYCPHCTWRGVLADHIKEIYIRA